MKIIVVTPTRPERSVFRKNLDRLVALQTLKPYRHIVIDDEGQEGVRDIGRRYRIGVERAKLYRADLIAFMEDDDYYAPTYLEMLAANYHVPTAIIGISHSIYYHIKTNKWSRFAHPGRASTNATAIKIDAPFRMWADDCRYVDLDIWQKLRPRQFILPTEKELVIGIKHGMVLTGGGGHQKDWRKYKNEDKDWAWLSSQIDSDSLKFYQWLQLQS